MAPRGHEPGDAAVRRFLLAGPPGADGRARLAEGEAEHARRVLRLSAGDRLVGLDGRGGTWPLVVVGSERGSFEVALCGEPRLEPAPGEAGAPLPWIEVAVALPRGERAEPMIDRLVQLGAAAISLLASERATAEARGGDARRLERLQRIAREACKQSGRSWLPEIGAPERLSVLLEARRGADHVVLDGRVPASMLDVLGALATPRWTRARPLVLWIGPEGGFAPAELATLDAAGAARARLGPHVLRVETAAEAALAIAVVRCQERAHPSAADVEERS